MSTTNSNPRTIYVGAFVAFAVLATCIALSRVYYLRRWRRLNAHNVPLYVPQYPQRNTYSPYIPPAPPYNQQPPYGGAPYTPYTPTFPSTATPSSPQFPKASVAVPERRPNPGNNVDPARWGDGADRSGSRTQTPTRRNDDVRRTAEAPPPPPSEAPPAYAMDGRD